MTRPAPAALRAVPVAALAVALLAGCSSSTGTPTAAGPAAPSGASRAPAGARPAGFGGLSGTIAAVGTGSFTLTAAGGTATVDWTSSTTFDRTAAASPAAVTPGSCVAVTETPGSDASTGSVDAAAVRISAPVNGSCGAGAAFGGSPGGGRRSGGTGAPPSGYAGRTPGAGGMAGRVLVGTVDSVSGTSVVVDVTAPGADGASSSTTTTTVAVSGTTTYTATTTASAADLAVGECARVVDGARAAGATGSPSAALTGPVTARSVTLSAPVGGTCPTPAAGRRGAGTSDAGTSGASSGSGAGSGAAGSSGATA